MRSSEGACCPAVTCATRSTPFLPHVHMDKAHRMCRNLANDKVNVVWTKRELLGNSGRYINHFAVCNWLWQPVSHCGFHAIVGTTGKFYS